jgi:addiction module RelB/DinJ family antitoxin
MGGKIGPFGKSESLFSRIDWTSLIGHNWSMTVLFRCRIDEPVLKKADRIAKRLGTSTPEMVRMFVAQIARTGKVPLSLKAGEAADLVESWEQRAARLESFYDSSKTW